MSAKLVGEKAGQRFESNRVGDVSNFPTVLRGETRLTARIDRFAVMVTRVLGVDLRVSALFVRASFRWHDPAAAQEVPFFKNVLVILGLRDRNSFAELELRVPPTTRPVALSAHAN